MKVHYGLKDDYRRIMIVGKMLDKDTIRREIDAGMIVGLCLVLGMMLILTVALIGS